MSEQPLSRDVAGRVGSGGMVFGREREQTRLEAHLRTALEGNGQLVLVGGDAGIGKTTLVRSLAATAGERGAVCAIGHCYDLSSTPPYGPWRDLFGRLPAREGTSAVPPGLGDNDSGLGSPSLLFQQVRQALAEESARQPLLLVLEDLHWSDPASLELLRYTGQQLSGLAALLAVTYRTDELHRRHPLTQVIPALVREAGAERIDLRPLDEDAIRALVRQRYALAPDAVARLVDRLGRFAEGNPFYVQELLRDLEEERILRPGEGGWTLGDLERARVPALIQQVLEARLDRLGESVREQLAVAAVIGQRVPLALWGAIAGLSEEEILQTVERAVDARLLEASEDGEHAGFAHALVREALYGGILPPRRRVWHRKVAERLISTSAPDPDAVAYHLEQAGDPRAVEWLVRAGERASHAYAWMTAKERFAAAVARLEGDPERDRERGWLMYRTGRMLRFGDTAAGIDYLEEAERIARAIGDPVLAAYATFDAGTIRWLTMLIEHGLAPMKRAADEIESLPPDHLQDNPEVVTWIADAVASRHRSVTTPATTLTPRRGTLALVLAYAGDFAGAAAMATALLGEIDAVSETDALLLSGVGDAWFAIGVVEAGMGRPAEARAALRQSRDFGKEIDHHFMVALNLSDELREVVLPYLTTDLALRRALVAEATAEWTRGVGALPSDLATRLYELDLLLLEGNWDEAARIARPFTGASLPFNREYAVLASINLARWRGEPDEAWALIDGWMPNGPETEPGGHRYRFAVGLHRLACDLALDRGDPATAARWLDTHDRWLAASGAVQGRAESRTRWARFAWLSGDLDRAREVTFEAIELASEPRQPLALLAAYRQLGEIEIASGRLDEAVAPVAVARELAEACAAPFERALTLLAQAERHAARREPAVAARLLREIRPAVERLGAKPTLARIDALLDRLPKGRDGADGPSRLSSREREVLTLVAAGRSNPEIARELFISERTVTTHLTHIYEKLEVTARAQAVEVAVRHGLI